MKNLDFILDVPESVKDYLFKLQKNDKVSFHPSLSGLTNEGEKLQLGFSTYGLKLYYMLGIWDQLDNNHKDKWSKFINSFQQNIKSFPKNSYIDPVLLNSYKEQTLKKSSIDLIKKTMNFSSKYNYETNEVKLSKAINAETKQAIATLYEVDFKNDKLLENIYSNEVDLLNYLENLNWMTPWTSGAQFSSICVYATTQSYKYKSTLVDFIKQKADPETGSYFSTRPNSNREIINGAMKVISGLDWIEEEIHYPEKLIDFCLENKPINEGCDVVDFIYVMYKCLKQSNYKKLEVNNLLKDSISEIKNLYKEKEGGFSYFVDKSQTHYYGVPITKGNNVADLHGTLLCTWAIMMILESNELLDKKYNIIKP